MSSGVFAIVPAAGTSSRFGAGASKLLKRVGELTVLERTITGLLKSKALNCIALAIREEDRDLISKLLQPIAERYSTPLHLIKGGATRQESVSNVLGFYRKSLLSNDQEIVLVHDAARCFVSTEIVRRSIEFARKYRAVTVAIPLVDTVKRATADGRVLETVPRADLWAIQTPQVFECGLLARAHLECGTFEATDDAQLVERIHPVYLVPGSKLNFKVTTPEDLELAVSVAAMRRQDPEAL